MVMPRPWVYLTLGLLAVLNSAALHAGAEPQNLWGKIWVQPAFGMSTGDETVTGDVTAEVGMTGIPLIGSINAALPLTAEVEFENPVGLMFGAEIVFHRIGIEVNGVYVHRAAIARGGLRVRNGLLSEQQCQTLETIGIAVADVIVADEDIKNIGVTLGANYHYGGHGRWDIFAGPMVVWTAWGQYDLSDAGIEIRTSLESALYGRVDRFDLSENPSVAPQDALTLGAVVGAAYNVYDGWGVVGSLRYFFGDEVDVSGGRGSYRIVSFSVGVERSFGR
jgi:hypothetical protein